MDTIYLAADVVAAGKDYDEALRIIAIGLGAAALLYAIVATWVVTPKGDGHH